MSKIDTLFLDIGGVILTNGWDHVSRKKGSDKFGLNWEEFDKRHKQHYDSHEKGQITLEEYLNLVVFYEKRNFTLDQFKQFMFEQSQPHPEMLNLIKDLKIHFDLRVAAVSNEGKDLIEYRIKTYNLKSFVDDFFISCFLGIQKPDQKIYEIALNVMQVVPNQILYIDDRKNLVEAASKFGVNGIVHTSFEDTRRKLLELIA